MKCVCDVVVVGVGCGCGELDATDDSIPLWESVSWRCLEEFVVFSM